jgi:hypothetical protein
MTPGGTKGSRYIDIVGVDSDGKLIEIHQVGRQTKAGIPVSRERSAIDDIQNALERVMNSEADLRYFKDEQEALSQ